MLATYHSPAICPSKLLGLPYRLGGDGSNGIDCIHLTYRVLAWYGIPTPAFNADWYEQTVRQHYRDLRSWGELIKKTAYNGDVVWLSGDNPVFAAIWDLSLIHI